MHPVQCPAPATGAAVRAGHLLRWVAPCCACLVAKTRVLAVGTLASTTCNNFIADLLFLSEVSHSLLVAGWGALRTPLFWPWPWPWACGLRLAARCGCGCGCGLRAAGLGPRPLRRSTRFWGWPAAQKAESRASGSGTSPQPAWAVLLDLSLSAPRRSPATSHQIFKACGAAPILDWPAAQKAESRASGSGARPPPQLRIGALLSLPLSSSSATKFSRPAAQHPFWTGLRRRRQKAEQSDRGLPPPSGGGG
jgi:hypothetical protein